MQVVVENAERLARKPGTQPQPIVPARVARPARMRRRHLGALASFLVLVLLPLDAVTYYLYYVAKDQYASRVGFSVQREEVASAIEMLGGLAELSGSSSSDTDILAEFITSQEMVERIGARLDLSRIYTVEDDPVFSLGAAPTVEDLLAQWRRMVTLDYDPGTGLIELRVKAFSAADATGLAQAAFDESSAMINRLSAIARQDAMRHAEEEVTRAVARLKTARQALTAFRARTQIVDPASDLEERMHLIGALQTQLSEALVELDLLHETTQPSDPQYARAERRNAVLEAQIVQAERRKAVLEARLAEERGKFGSGEGGAAYSGLVAEYESLSVDLRFAEEAYLSALTAYEAARVEARRQSRYLTAYLGPTEPQRAEYPQRLTLLLLTAGFLTLFWSVTILTWYSLRDRR